MRKGYAYTIRAGCNAAKGPAARLRPADGCPAVIPRREAAARHPAFASAQTTMGYSGSFASARTKRLQERNSHCSVARMTARFPVWMHGGPSEERAGEA